ncbi:MAG: hypothetical protein K0U60_09135 [Actinomycetia bacterium]|nr:hypothetical protein [Actinomycetes bacterium]MCH9800855.1 hypothetical protein [Actinomycetes bacterium]
MFPPARERAPEGEAPWWESADHLPELKSVPPQVDQEPTPATIDLTDSTTATQAQPDAIDNENATAEVEAAAEPKQMGEPLSDRPDRRPASGGGVTARGAFLVIVVCCAVGCGIGFLTTGTTSIPSQAGWGLVVGSVIAALLSPPKLGWAVVWLPPLAAATVVALLGQVTLLGAAPTLAREIAMIAAGLTTLAPAQVLSVALAAVLLLLRRKLTKST